MRDLLKGNESYPSLFRKQSTPDSLTDSDQAPREETSAIYQDPRYTTLLKTKDSYMHESDLDITDASKALIKTLLKNPQPVPQDTLFRDDIFKTTCQKLQAKNAARIIQYVSRLLVPSAETLATLGDKTLDVLAESVNERWENAIPLRCGSRPQPDYAWGFKREAFTEANCPK